MTGGIAGLILAGGRGRRMGGVDKALLSLADETLVARAARRLAPQVSRFAISANGDPGRLGVDVPVLPDGIADAGPLGGVLEGLGWAAVAGFDALATVSVDTPFFPRDLVARLAEAGGAAIAATGEDGAPQWHPTCALWPVDLRGRLKDWLLLGDRKVMLFAEAEGARPVFFDDARAFFNVNAPEDVETARALYRR